MRVERQPLISIFNRQAWTGLGDVWVAIAIVVAEAPFSSIQSSVLQFQDAPVITKHLNDHFPV